MDWPGAELADLLDALEQGICLLDDEAVVQVANRAFARMFGNGSGPFAGRTLAEAAPALAGEIDWALAARKAVGHGRTLRLARHELDDGRRVDCRLDPVALGPQQRRWALLTLTDVSEEVGLERRLLRQARTQALANFGDSIAHEVRNPLNSIHMNVQLLRETLKAEPLDRDRLEHTAATVQREIRRLDRVVRDFVHYSRPPALRLEPGSINNVVRAALDLLDAQIRARHIRVDADLQSARPVVMDRDRIQRAVYNVLLNAVQVVPEGGHILCRSRDEERRCLLEIHDDGPGIDPDQSAHIFEIFYTTKKGGTGLGLPIANRIVEEHGGRMAVASAPGRGATFAFFLPFEGPPAPQAQGPTTVPQSGGEETS